MSYVCSYNISPQCCCKCKYSCSHWVPISVLNTLAMKFLHTHQHLCIWVSTQVFTKLSWAVWVSLFKRTTAFALRQVQRPKQDFPWFKLPILSILLTLNEIFMCLGMGTISLLVTSKICLYRLLHVYRYYNKKVFLLQHVFIIIIIIIIIIN